MPIIEYLQRWSRRFSSCSFIRPWDRQRNSDVYMNLISFAKELIWCQGQILYYYKFNESLSIPNEQVLSVEKRGALTFLRALFYVKLLTADWLRQFCKMNAFPRYLFPRLNFPKKWICSENKPVYENHRSVIDDCITMGNSRRHPGDQIHIDFRSVWCLSQCPLFHLSKPRNVTVRRFHETSRS